MARAPKAQAAAAGIDPAAAAAKAEAERVAAEEAAKAEAERVAAEEAAAEAARADSAPINIDLTDGYVEVRSTSPTGRRRSGHAFGPAPVRIALDALPPRELDGILNDPQLLAALVPAGSGPD